MLRNLWHRVRKIIRLYFVAGLLALAPIAVTFWVVGWIIRRLDNLLLPRLISLLFPNLEAAPNLPPLVGAIFTVLVILLFGVIVRHFFGQELVRLGERVLHRVPVARTVYVAVKQLFEAILQAGPAAYNRVIIIEYPRVGLYCLAFTTGPARGPVQDAIPGTRLLNCFVPTTPNPTSGFYLVIPEADVRDVDLTVEEAFKVVMSAGLVSPDQEAPTPVPVETTPS